jgi:hypothetical protein
LPLSNLTFNNYSNNLSSNNIIVGTNKNNNLNLNLNKTAKKENNPNNPNTSRETNKTSKKLNPNFTSNQNIPRVNKFDIGSGTSNNSNNTYKTTSNRTGSNSVNVSSRRPLTTSVEAYPSLQSKVNVNSKRNFNFRNNDTNITTGKLSKPNTNNLNHTSIQNISTLANSNKSKSVANSSLKYCPRIHSATVMKKVIYY